MKFCTDCWNFDRCNAIGRVVDFSVDDGVCRDFDECKPQTNADRIRAMNDEGLSVWLMRLHTICECCSAKEECDTIENDEVCRRGVLEWLKKIAEGE